MIHLKSKEVDELLFEKYSENQGPGFLVTLEAYRRLGLDYVLVPQSVIPLIPIWNGNKFFHDIGLDYTWSFVHEMLHYAVASPTQRSKPDFGLGRHIDAEAPRWLPQGTETHNPAWGTEQPVKRTTARHLEGLSCSLFYVAPLMAPAGGDSRVSLAEDCIDTAVEFNASYSWDTLSDAKKGIGTAIDRGGETLTSICNGASKGEMIDYALSLYKESII